MTPKIYDSEPPPVQGRSRFIILWSMYTNICLDVCDPVGFRPDRAFEVARVGRCSVHVGVKLVMNCVLRCTFYFIK